jgi:hypothetical protein
MDQPLNEKQRNQAILKFSLVCVFALAMVIYHYIISAAVYSNF